MILETTISRMEEPGLFQAASVLSTRAEQVSKSDWSYIEFIDKLLQEEVATRKQRSLMTRTRLAKIPVIKTLKDFDFDAQSGVDRKLINDLATLSFLDRTDNVIFLGPPGVGKLHLTIGLTLRALEEGYTAYFVTLDDMITDLRHAKANNKLGQRLKKYLKSKLLVIDEVGYLPLEKHMANLFFQLVSRRYEHGSIILTSNKSYGDWAEFLGDPVIAAAILDRLLHHSVTVNIRGESYRLKNRRKAGISTPQPTKEVDTKKE